MVVLFQRNDCVLLAGLSRSGVDRVDGNRVEKHIGAVFFDHRANIELAVVDRVERHVDPVEEFLLRPIRFSFAFAKEPANSHKAGGC